MSVDPHSNLKSNNTPKLSCKDIWKVFGNGALDFLNESKTTPKASELISAGLIGAVRNVSLEISEVRSSSLWDFLAVESQPWSVA